MVEQHELHTGRPAIPHGTRGNALSPCADECMHNPGARRACLPLPALPLSHHVGLPRLVTQPPCARGSCRRLAGCLPQRAGHGKRCGHPRRTVPLRRGLNRGPCACALPRQSLRSGGVCHFPAAHLESTAEPAACGNGEPSYCLGPTPAGGMRRGRCKQHLPRVHVTA